MYLSTLSSVDVQRRVRPLPRRVFVSAPWAHDQGRQHLCGHARSTKVAAGKSGASFPKRTVCWAVSAGIWYTGLLYRGNKQRPRLLVNVEPIWKLYHR